jgi:hypothetical protein
MSMRLLTIRSRARTRVETMHAAPRRRPAARPAAATLMGGAALAAVFAACEGPERPVAPTEIRRTLGAGSQSTLLGRATLAERFHVKRKTGGWQIDVHAKDPTDVAVQSITFQPGGHSGWHRHPGPVFIQVVSGTVTFYESDDRSCTPIVRTAGQAYLDAGEHAHIARNESGAPATNVVTYFAPPGAALRIDAPAPGNCPF